MTNAETRIKESPVYEDSLEFARRMDSADPLRRFRLQFIFPTKAAIAQSGATSSASTTSSTSARSSASTSARSSLPSSRDESGGDDCIYLTGNSLGLQPRKTQEYVDAELEDWARLGVEGHFEARHPWLAYHEFVTDMSARLVGAKPIEVVTMNTLTVNLHLMLVSFYRPTKARHKILIEANAFPSDQYAIASQVRFHGYDPAEAIVELKPKAPGEYAIDPASIIEEIEKHGKDIALIVLGDVNYLSGQAFDAEAIAQAARKQGCLFGLNLAHGAGNLVLQLHGWGVDFAVWCNYKYVNAGPGSLAGCFVHERHARAFELPRFAGWWGHNKKTRFEMGPQFDPIEGAEGWQLSNPPILQLAALRASLELFDEATMPALREKGDKLTGYLQFLLERLPDNFCTVMTPPLPHRGNQLSLRTKNNPRELLKLLKSEGVVCDFREPNIIRAAPAPLYNSFEDIYNFAQLLKRHA